MNYNLIKRRNQRRREKLFKFTLLMLSYVAIFMVMNIYIHENEELLEVIKQKDNIVAEKDQEIFQLRCAIDDLGVVITDMNDVIEDMDTQLTAVSTVNKVYVDELNFYKNREELYNKYEYAIVYGGERTELTYEQIEYGEELMLAKGYDPDLMFGSIMVESNAKPTVVNKESGATGYGQFLDSTAKWVWTNLLGNDSYHSDIRKDGTSNIQMMAAYYDYLYSTKGNTFDVVKCYSGNTTDEGTKEYLARVYKFISKVDAVIQ